MQNITFPSAKQAINHEIYRFNVAVFIDKFATGNDVAGNKKFLNETEAVKCSRVMIK